MHTYIHTYVACVHVCVRVSSFFNFVIFYCVLKVIYLKRDKILVGKSEGKRPFR